jgi:hypothetical protein
MKQRQPGAPFSVARASGCLCFIQLRSAATRDEAP